MQAHFRRFMTVSFCLAASATVALAESGSLDMRYEPGTTNFVSGSSAAVGGPLDEYKNVQLDDNWTMSLGGQIRYRFESETNKGFGATEPAQDAFHLLRDVQEVARVETDGQRLARIAHLNLLTRFAEIGVGR